MSLPKSLAMMAVPTVFSQIIILIYSLADTFYVGKVNDPFMVAGASLILPVFNICLSLAGLTGVGGGALVSRLLGAGNSKEAKKISSFCIILSVFMSAMFSLTMLAFMEPILKLLGASENTFEYARQYAFCVIVLGGVPTVMSNVLSNLLRSEGESAKAGFGITFGGLLNIALDPLFMFVIMDRGNELLGVGIATLLSNCISCLYFIIIIILKRGKSVIVLSLREGLPSGNSIKQVFSIGLPSAAGVLLFDIDYIIIDKLMSGYGDIALAAVGIVLKAERLPLNVGVGICQGMIPIVAYNHSSGNRKRMLGILKLALITGICVGIFSIITYELFAGNILNIFINDPATVSLGTDFLRVRCLATPLMFISFFTVHLFQAVGKGGAALFLGVSRWVLFNIPMLYILNHIMGMYGIVWSQVTADVLTVLLSLIIYLRHRKELAGNVPRERMIDEGGEADES